MKALKWELGEVAFSILPLCLMRGKRKFNMKMKMKRNMKFNIKMKMSGRGGPRSGLETTQMTSVVEKLSLDYLVEEKRKLMFNEERGHTEERGGSGLRSMSVMDIRKQILGICCCYYRHVIITITL